MSNHTQIKITSYITTFLILSWVTIPYVMRCAIWYHLYHLKNVKNTHGGVLLLAPKVTHSFMGVCHFFILYKYYGALSSLRHLKIMKNAFYFTSKSLLVLKIFKFLSWHFGHVAKRLDMKDKVDFKIYDVTAWFTNNFNTYIVQYLEKEGETDNEIWSVNKM